MSAEPVPGAPMVWPAWGPDGIVHLARTEARKDAPPALLAVCPDGPRDDLQLVPRRLWRPWRKWCPDCAAYRDYLARRPSK